MKNEAEIKVKIPKKLKDELAEMAKHNNLSLQEMVTLLLAEVVPSFGKQPAPAENEPLDS